MKGAVVFGGYGTFGRLVARELAAVGVPVTVAGRDRHKAAETARALGTGHRALAASLAAPATYKMALDGQAVAVNCAGFLAQPGPSLLDNCLEAGCHYVDIAVEREHAELVRARSADFRQRGLTAAYGCSSLPAISGALALTAAEGQANPPTRTRVTLFIGNDNPKGRGAVVSLLRILGQPITAPQGLIRGFRDREVVELPPPFGRHGVFNFDSPEYDLFPALLGTPAVAVKVGFELRLATYGFALLALTGLRLGARTAAVIEKTGEWLRWVGCSGGAVLSELFYPDGTVRHGCLLARRDGQRMAALPCALVAQELCRGQTRAVGSLTAYEFFGARELLDRMMAHGFELTRGTRSDGS